MAIKQAGTVEGPESKASHEAFAPVAEGRMALRVVSVLFVDDDPRIRDAMSAIMPKMGHKIEIACNGEEALDSLRKGAFDVVVTDLHMPVMDGLQMMREMKKERPAMPVIFVSAIDGEEEARALREAGACAVLRKPMDLEELESAILAAVGI